MQKATIVTQEWDKTFLQSSLVKHRKVVFHNRYGIELVGISTLPKIPQLVWQPLRFAAHSGR